MPIDSDVPEEPRVHSTTEAPLLKDDPVHETASSIKHSELDQNRWNTFPYFRHFGLGSKGPASDDFEMLLKPLLDRDTKQCSVWKEEVQNLLILAGLFSAVVTAFVIESYQTLQSDPNDQIISLLSRIADQMDTPKGNISPNTTFPSSSGFVPSPSNVRVNIFWFISLVLSLTVALIGIVALQWLREHQLYESGIASSQAFAIFNARSDGLKRWYVPQLFAVLPVLLQAALVLFFLGLIEFLFAIRIDVAVPVAASLAIPILFLTATTVLPTLQLYTMNLPHFLRVNGNVPAPCPYKSPQALIFQRAAIASALLFNLYTRAVGAVWIPFVVIIRLFARSDQPFYGKLAPFSTRNYHYQSFFRRLRNAARNWITMDAEWLSTRTSYAVAMHTPVTFRHLQWPYLGNSELARIVTFYDRVQALKHIASNSNPADAKYRTYLHGGMKHTISAIIQSLDDEISAASTNAQLSKAVQAHLTALLGIVGPYAQQQTEKLVKRSRGSSNAVYRVFYAILADQAFGFEFDLDHTTIALRLEVHVQLTEMHLSGDAHALFLCSNLPGITPSVALSTRRSFSYHRERLEKHNQEWMEHISSCWTDILTNVIVDTRKMIPVQPFTHKCTGSANARCGSNLHTESIIELTEYILLFQVPDEIQKTLRLLHDLYKSKPNPVEDRPFVLIISCAYINAVANVNQVNVDGFGTLLDSICALCGSLDATLEQRPDGLGKHWPSMETALEYIRNHANGQPMPSVPHTPDPPHTVKAGVNTLHRLLGGKKHSISPA